MADPEGEWQVVVRRKPRGYTPPHSSAVAAPIINISSFNRFAPLQPTLGSQIADLPAELRVIVYGHLVHSIHADPSGFHTVPCYFYNDIRLAAPWFKREFLAESCRQGRLVTTYLDDRDSCWNPEDAEVIWLGVKQWELEGRLGYNGDHPHEYSAKVTFDKSRVGYQIQWAHARADRVRNARYAVKDYETMVERVEKNLAVAVRERREQDGVTGVTRDSAWEVIQAFLFAWKHSCDGVGSTEWS